MHNLFSINLYQMFAGIVKGLTLGTINIHDNGSVAIKDPITGMNDIALSVYDGRHNFSKGVWLGKRPMKALGFGFSSFVL